MEDRYYENLSIIREAGGYSKIMVAGVEVVTHHLQEVAAMPMVDAEDLLTVHSALEAGCADLAAARLIDAADAAELAQWKAGWDAAPAEEQVYYSGHGGVPPRSWEPSIVRLSGTAQKELLAARASLLGLVAAEAEFESDDGTFKHNRHYMHGCCAAGLAGWYLEARRSSRLIILPKYDIDYYGQFYAAVEILVQNLEKEKEKLKEAHKAISDRLMEEAFPNDASSPVSFSDFFGFDPLTTEELKSNYLAAVEHHREAEAALDAMFGG
ncbi:MAG: hypothetical protein LBD10_14640 [Desulfobulbus sp.]|jgi:hypothetical protein|uniref:hypothetical protein n=1 Tax=Desulfobulbus sp. TaxID=895 RepID=UPI00283BFE23|nr:hypothetical protein [Desulfobulbus sp.]MDR2551425.1 hypothetical protein [Desulfobulbus sp.]